MAYHGKAGFGTFSHYRTVVGNDLPFTITGTAAPPFGKSLQLGANAALRVARMRVHPGTRQLAVADCLLAGPPVVGLAGRAALDGRPEHDCFRKFVARQRL